MDLLFAFVVSPVLGVLWFNNLTSFMEKLNKGKDTRNQKILGGFLTFLLITSVMYSLAIIMSY